jgi:hypothetical protein
MHDATDMDLLRQYAGGNSDAAFTFPKTVSAAASNESASPGMEKE